MRRSKHIVKVQNMQRDASRFKGIPRVICKASVLAARKIARRKMKEVVKMEPENQSSGLTQNRGAMEPVNQTILQSEGVLTNGH